MISFVQFKTGHGVDFPLSDLLSVHNTLYLEVHCPAVRPHIVVVSDCGRSVVDFVNVSIGKNENINFSLIESDLVYVNFC